MMVKKKSIETEDNIEKENTQTSENKENNQSTGENKKDPEKMTSRKESGEQTLKSEDTEEPEGDKSPHEGSSFEEKLAEMQDKYVRLSAEFDNYRKRTLKEKMEISKFAGEELLKCLLPFADDFERALKHLETSTDCTGMKEGIDLIYGKFIEFLRQQGVKEIDSLNMGFNVDLHDAVAKVPVPEEEKKGKVVEVLLKGYYLKDKIIRHSKVVIGE